MSINTNEGWSKDIKCNIKVMKMCPLSPTIYGIYINKLEEYLNTTSCKHIELAGIMITLLLYDDVIIILAKSHDDLDKQLKDLHVYYSKIGMIVNTDNTKVDIIKSKKSTHGSFIYGNHCLHQVYSYQYLGNDFPHHHN